MAYRNTGAGTPLYQLVCPPQRGFTITFWLYLESIHAAYGLLWAHSDDTWTTYQNLLLNASGNGLRIANSSVSQDGTTTLSATRWYHVALTYDGATYRVYLDGQPEITLNNNYTMSATTVLICSDGVLWADCRMAYLKTWAAVLTQAEIQTEMAVAAPARSTDLWGDFRFTNDANLLKDQTAAHHDWTPYGTTAYAADPSLATPSSSDSATLAETSQVDASDLTDEATLSETASVAVGLVLAASQAGSQIHLSWAA